MINFKVTNCNLRNIDLFYPFPTSINVMMNSPINRILNLVNMYNIDPFVISLNEFKRNVNLVAVAYLGERGRWGQSPLPKIFRPRQFLYK
jgi:hypothetical protein